MEIGVNGEVVTLSMDDETTLLKLTVKVEVEPEVTW